VRVSTDQQTVAHQQLEALRAVAERRGWAIVETYNDAGISGAKGRDQCPGLYVMLKDASRRKFDAVMAWANAPKYEGLPKLATRVSSVEASLGRSGRKDWRSSPAVRNGCDPGINRQACICHSVS
jgi:Resolvase, N terminal domain